MKRSWMVKILRVLLALPLLFVARLALIVLFVLFTQARSGHFDRRQFVLQTYRRNCSAYRYPYSVLWLARGDYNSESSTWAKVFGCL